MGINVQYELSSLTEKVNVHYSLQMTFTRNTSPFTKRKNTTHVGSNRNHGMPSELCEFDPPQALLKNDN